MTTTLREYDVYRCCINDRVGYRALLHPSKWPSYAELHLDTVTAAGKCEAVKQVLAERDWWLKILR